MEQLSVIQDVVESKKAEEIVLLDMRGLSSEVDAFLICHGTSIRQVKAIAEAVDEKLKEIGERPLFIEGLNEGTWVLIDCGDVAVHIFQEQTRRYYRLEELWSHARLMGPRISPKPAQTSELV